MTVIAVHAHVAGPILRRADVVPPHYREAAVPGRVFVIPCGYVNVYEKTQTYDRCGFSAHSGTLYCLRHQQTIARHPCLQGGLDPHDIGNPR